MFGKSIIAVVLGGFLLMGAALPAQAHYRDHCQDRIYRAEANLRHAIRRHGVHSRQAQRRRHELQQARARCHEFNDRGHRGRDRY